MLRILAEIHEVCPRGQRVGIREAPHGGPRLFCRRTEGILEHRLLADLSRWGTRARSRQGSRESTQGLGCSGGGWEGLGRAILGLNLGLGVLGGLSRSPTGSATTWVEANMRVQFSG